MKFVIPCCSSFLLTAVLTPLVILLATWCRCLDLPGTRRVHQRVTPRWGGLAFFAGVLPVLLYIEPEDGLAGFIAGCFLLVGVGVVDDLKSLGWGIKMAAMATAATLVIFVGDMTIHQIGYFGTAGRLELGWYSIPFTYLCIIGVTNAINLIDGLDGLAGGISLIAFLFMGIAAAGSGNLPAVLLCLAYVGALAAFLLFNFPVAKIFMGDSGSIFLGFSLSFMAIWLTQEAGSTIEPMFPLLVLLLPVFDTLRVLIVRMWNGKNPFKADNLHLHHLMLKLDFSPVTAVLLFWLMTAAFGSIALKLTGSTSELYFLAVLCSFLFLVFFAAGLYPVQPAEQKGGTLAHVALSSSAVVETAESLRIQPRHEQNVLNMD